MKYNLFIKLFLVLFTISTISKVVYAQGSAVDQYRQMGGVVGLTEICFGTKDLETVLFQQVGNVFYTSPEMGRVMFELLYVYFESYEVAKSEKVIWNGTQQAYNTNTFDCSEENKTLIKSFEQQLIAGLQ